MLVHMVTPEVGESDWDYDRYKIIATHRINNIDEFLRFIKQFKDDERPIEYRGNWYNLLEYAFVFPEDYEHLPMLRLYVSEY